jgi:hypothetical protein
MVEQALGWQPGRNPLLAAAVKIIEPGYAPVDPLKGQRQCPRQALFGRLRDIERAIGDGSQEISPAEWRQTVASSLEIGD